MIGKVWEKEKTGWKEIEGNKQDGRREGNKQDGRREKEINRMEGDRRK